VRRGNLNVKDYRLINNLRTILRNEGETHPVWVHVFFLTLEQVTNKGCEQCA
jgi:hypothetical protein